MSCSPASGLAHSGGLGARGHCGSRHAGEVGSDGSAGEAMGAFAWRFLLRKVLSGLPGLTPPCCAVRARGGGTGLGAGCPRVSGLRCGGGGVAAVLMWMLWVGWSQQHPSEERSWPVPGRAAVRGCRCHFVLRVCCSCLPARLGGACERPPRSPCLAEVRQNTSIVSRGLSAASQEQRIKCSSEEDN